MKKTILPFLSLFILVTFFSCENEPLDFDLSALDSTNSGSSGNSSNIGTPGGNSTGDYWPMAVGNKWVHSNSLDGMTQDDSVMEISALEDYQGIPSYRYDQFMGIANGTDGTMGQDLDFNIYTVKNGGDYHVSIDDLSITVEGIYDITQSAYSYIMLKDYEDVGTIWVNEYQITTTTTVLIDGLPNIPDTVMDVTNTNEILAKDISIDVDGTTYSPVIKVKSTTLYEIPGSPNSSGEYIYYFAKDVGIVKAEGTFYDADDNITSTSLNELISVTLY
ncbi:MAG TPA: hypothetical protein EYO76_03720 [Flavobacteriaceae bacterium]|nr:hypothetical protein [Flavobacteriaceae bacterium]